MSAYFNQTPVDGGGGNARTPPVLAVPTKEQDAEVARLDKEIAAVEERIAAREKEIAESGEITSPWRVLIPETLAAEDQNRPVDPGASV